MRKNTEADRWTDILKFSQKMIVNRSANDLKSYIGVIKSASILRPSGYFNLHVTTYV